MVFFSDQDGKQGIYNCWPYAGIMLYAFQPLLCLKLCRHNRRRPNIRTSIRADSPKFYCWPAACIRRPKFLLDLPSWQFAKVFSPMQYFADSPKFYAANVSRCTVMGFCQNF